MADARVLSLGYRSMWGGIAAAFVGATSLVGYFLKLPVPLVIELLPGVHSPMSVSEALCLTLAGGALTLRASSPRLRRAAHLAAGLALAVTLANFALWLPGAVPHVRHVEALAPVQAGSAPLRMVPDVAVFLLCFVATYILSCRRPSAALEPWLRLLISAQVLLTLWGLIGQLHGSTLSFGAAPMAQLSALGLGALTWGVYESRNGVAIEDTLAAQAPEARLQLRCALGMIVIASVALLASFDLAQWRFQRRVEADVAQRVNERAQLVASEFDSFVERGKIVATRPRTRELLDEGVHGPGGDWREGLNAIARSYLPAGYSAVALLDNQQRVVAGAGTFRGATALSIPYPAAVSARLLWDGELFMQIDEQILDGGRIVGHAVTQQPLERLTRMLRTGSQWGETGELQLCSAESITVVCFPTRFRDAPFTLHDSPDSSTDVVARALDGQFGVTETRDYRAHAVLAAYRPLGPAHLVIVAKMDLDEVDRPFAQSFALALVALVVLIVCAQVYLRLAIRPLARSLVGARESARHSAAYFRDIFERNVDAILVVRTLRDGSGEVTDFEFTFSNAAAERLLGLARDQIIGKLLCDILPWARASGWFERCRKAVDTDQTADADVRADLTQAGSSWLQLHAAPLEDGLAITIRGIDERKSAQARLRMLAPIDEVTELPNRALFIDRLEHAMIRARRRRGLLAVLDIDIDGFNTVNENSGHAAGDSLLREFADRVKRCLRAEDTVARVGSDEFAVIIEGLHDRHEALRAADAILTTVRREMSLATGSVRVSASIGIAFFDGESGTAQQLLDEALGARMQVQSRGGDAHFHADAAESASTEQP